MSKNAEVTMLKETTDDLTQQTGLLTVREASQILGVHPNTLRRWNDLGIVKAFRLGTRRDRRFKPEDISHLLEGNRTA